jgi:hypothetical protein
MPNSDNGRQFQANSYSPESAAGGDTIFPGGLDGRRTPMVERTSEVWETSPSFVDRTQGTQSKDTMEWDAGHHQPENNTGDGKDNG